MEVTLPNKGCVSFFYGGGIMLNLMFATKFTCIFVR